MTTAVEANEAMRRIFWRHRWLLIFCLLAPVAVIAPLTMRQPLTYSAVASIQAQASAPQADTQVTAILSRVTTVAKSPSVVQNAINAAGVDRNALDVARHEVAVASLSSSAIVSLTVTDPSKQVAVSLARSLANGVVTILNALGTQSSQQLSALATQRAQLDATRTKLLKQMATAQTNHQLASSAGVQSLIAQLTAVDTQLSTNLASVQQVLTNSTINEGAGVINAPTYATGVSRHVASYSALAGLLGLVVGMLIATIHELARPTIAAAGAGARELSLVVLGDARLTNEETADLDDELAIRLDLAADRLGARTLVLTGPVPAAQLAALAAHITENLPAVTASDGDSPAQAGGARVSGIRALSPHGSPQASDTKSPTGSFSSISAHAASFGAARPGQLSVIAMPATRHQDRPEDPALVLVLPRFAPRAALDQAVDLGVITGWPLLGVISLRQQHKRRHRTARPAPAPAESAPPATWPPPASWPPPTAWPPQATAQAAAPAAQPQSQPPAPQSQPPAPQSQPQPPAPQPQSPAPPPPAPQPQSPAPQPPAPQPPAPQPPAPQPQPPAPQLESPAAQPRPAATQPAILRPQPQPPAAQLDPPAVVVVEKDHHAGAAL